MQTYISSEMKVSQPHKLLSVLLHLGTSSLFGDPIGLCEDSTEVINYKEGFCGDLMMKREGIGLLQLLEYRASQCY